jgi:hypothetical protein
MTRRSRIRAIVLDAGHTLLEMDYVTVTAYLRSRGHIVGEAAVIDAERRARIRLDVESRRHSQAASAPARDPGCARGVARAGGSSAAGRRVAGHQPHRCDQRLSAIRAPCERRSMFAPAWRGRASGGSSRLQKSARCPRCTWG